MNANADLLRISRLMEAPVQEKARTIVGSLPTKVWDADDFAREQIRSLVRQVFFTRVRPARQVVFNAVEAHVDIADLCVRVGRELASETRASIAVVEREPRAVAIAVASRSCGLNATLRARADQIGINLWRISELGTRESGEESRTGRYWLAGLADLRKEFEYAVIHGPPAGNSAEATLLGQLADGIILVLEANHTHRASARRIKEILTAAQVRILGSVLSERTFPIPGSIYRRL